MIFQKNSFEMNRLLKSTDCVVVLTFVAYNPDIPQLNDFFHIIMSRCLKISQQSDYNKYSKSMIIVRLNYNKTHRH